MLFRTSLLMLALLSTSNTHGAAASKYDIVELPSVCATNSLSNCGSFSYAYAINNSGVVVGHSQGPMIPDPADTTKEIRAFEAHAVRFQDGLLTDLGHLGKNESYAFAVNDAGDIAGVSRTVVGIEPDNNDEDSDPQEILQLRGYVIPFGGVMTDLGTPSVNVTAINTAAMGDSGVIVGYATAQVLPGEDAHYARGFIWSPITSQMTLIPALEQNTASYLRAVSSSAGRAVGFSVKGGAILAISVELDNPGVLTEIGTLGGTTSEANAIDDLGRVVGRSTTVNNQSIEGFIYDPLQNPAMRSIGQLAEGLRFSQANDINLHGDVVGTAITKGSPSQYHAVIYASAESDAVMIDLNNRIDCADDPSARWVLTEAVAINNSGQIIGYGSLGSTVRSFLLTPSTDTNPPVACKSVEPEFENQSGGGAFFCIFPLLFLMRRKER